MIKKILFVLLFLLLTASAFADINLGAGLKAGYGSSKSDLEDYAKARYTNYEYDDSSTSIFGIEAILDSNIGLPEQHRFGAKLGYQSRGSETIKFPYSPGVTGKYEVKYWEVPLTLYYKYMITNRWGVFAGFGGSLARAWDVAPSGEKITKVFPFVTGGAEYRFENGIALGLDLKYNAGAEFKKNSFLYRDVNGLEGTFAVRFYLTGL
ncbi:MAG: porin family protein [Spirochaetia bacterium]|jgi:hypothetical protein|nr:porin family protein [Spirochaetia bacterium]